MEVNHGLLPPNVHRIRPKDLQKLTKITAKQIRESCRPSRHRPV